MRRALRRGALIALAAGVVLAALPPVQARAKALWVMLESLGIEVPRPFASATIERASVVGGVRGDLYVSLPAGPPIVLIPGAAPRRDPRAVRTARALARAGRTVFVPELELGGGRLDTGDVELLVRCSLALDRRLPGRPALLGFSFGGSYALVAAADARLRGRLAVVATFGAFFSLEGLLQAATTGVSVVAGRRHRWRPDPRAKQIVRRVLLGAGADAAVVSALLANRDPELVPRLLERLDPVARGRLALVSPDRVEGSIRAPVIALHSTDDPAVPPAELERLRRALPEARTVLVSAFRHVDLRVAAAGDLWKAWRFTSWLLGAQEDWG